MRGHWRTIALLAAFFVGGCGEIEVSGWDGNDAAMPGNAVALGYWTMRGEMPLPGMPDAPTGRRLLVALFGMHRSDGEYNIEAIVGELYADGGIDAFDGINGEPEAFDGEPDCIPHQCQVAYAKVYEDSGRDFVCAEAHYEGGGGIRYGCRFLYGLSR